MAKKFNSKTAVVYANALYEGVGRSTPASPQEAYNCLKHDTDLILYLVTELKQNFGRNYVTYLSKILVSKELEKKFISPIFKRFLNIVMINKRENLIAKIIKRYHTLVREQSNYIEATVILSSDDEEHKIAQVIKLLESYLQKDIKYKMKINPEILGGCIVEFGSYIIDASISNTLDKLRDNAVTMITTALSNTENRS